MTPLRFAQNPANDQSVANERIMSTFRKWLTISELNF